MYTRNQGAWLVEHELCSGSANQVVWLRVHITVHWQAHVGLQLQVSLRTNELCLPLDSTFYESPYFFRNKNLISVINPFTHIYLTWNLPFSHSDQSIYQKSNSDQSIKTVGDFVFLNMENILANRAHPDVTARMSRLSWIYTVCKSWPLRRPLRLKGLSPYMYSKLGETIRTCKYFNPDIRELDSQF